MNGIGHKISTQIDIDAMHKTWNLCASNNKFINFAMKSLSCERSGYQVSSAYELNGFEWHTHTHKPVDRTKERFSKLIMLNFIMNFTHSLLLVKLKLMHTQVSDTPFDVRTIHFLWLSQFNPYLNKCHKSYARIL